MRGTPTILALLLLATPALGSTGEEFLCGNTFDPFGFVLEVSIASGLAPCPTDGCTVTVEGG